MKNTVGRAGWALAGALAIILLAALARVSEGGPLDPPGPVGSTLRSLDGLTPSWSLVLPSDDAPAADNCNSTRFQCVLSDTAVLDKETGLVWQRTPAISTIGNWFNALFACENRIEGARGGWHLATIEELSTLITFPANTPFVGPATPTDEYWSSTTDSFDASMALTRVLGSGVMNEKTKNTTGARAWCVRGGATPLS